MGLKDLFSSAGRSKSKLDKHIKTVQNQYAQSADRYYAMEQLLEMAEIPAIVGLMKRFTMNASKSIEDEEEKGWLYKRLLGLPLDTVLPAAKEFCLQSDNIAWVLRVVEELASKQQEWDILDALLAHHPPGYERDPSAKLQLLTHLQEIDDARVPDTLAGYLEDPDEGVRFFAVEALLDIGEPRSLGPLIARLGNPAEDSLRLRTRILTGLARLGWDVSAHRDVINKAIGNDHTFDGTHIKER
ncbi:HEAT repeat domain-containing protein [Nannocystis pusilla]|uniref:HEAT repeat domain-containing protein n=1 Tax=Nannocystis pusilla TaxID=889268 RepID=UPI003B7AE813